jgi:hypothetical protein
MEEHLEHLLYELGRAVKEGPLAAPRVVKALGALERDGHPVTMWLGGRPMLVVRQV